MKINGAEVEMYQCIKNHVYLVDSKTRLAYYFDDEEQLNSIPEQKAISLLKNGTLTGMIKKQYSPGVYLWYPTPQLDKIESFSIEIVSVTFYNWTIYFSYETFQVKSSVQHGLSLFRVPWLLPRIR